MLTPPKRDIPLSIKNNPFDVSQLNYGIYSVMVLVVMVPIQFTKILNWSTTLELILPLLLKITTSERKASAATSAHAKMLCRNRTHIVFFLTPRTLSALIGRSVSEEENAGNYDLARSCGNLVGFFLKERKVARFDSQCDCSRSAECTGRV